MLLGYWIYTIRGIYNMLPFPILMNTVVHANPLFLMENFVTTGDIRDKSTNSIPITINGTFGVGSDEFGTYMNFTGTQWIELKNSILDTRTIEINLTIGGLSTSGRYAKPLIDCRPTGTNGNYFGASVSTNLAAPYKINYGYGTSTFVDTPVISALPVQIKFKISSTQIRVYFNSELVQTLSSTLVFQNQYIKIGRSAFASAGVPNFTGRIYHIDMYPYTL